MIRNRLFPVIAFGLATLAAAPASAQSAPVCSERESALKHLAEKYSEVPVAMGVASNGSLVEVLTNDKGTSWTIILTKPGGISCIVAAGEGWVSRKRLAMDPQV